MSTTPYNPKRQRPAIDEAGILKAVRAGQPVLLGEYRGTAVEKIEYNDKQTGKKEFFMKIAHTLEVTQPGGAMEVVTVEERSLDGLDNAEGYVSGLKKGQMVVLRLAGLQSVKGRKVASVPAEDGAIAVLA